MKTPLFPLFLAGAAMISGCKRAPSGKSENWVTHDIETGFARLDDSTMCLVEADNITKEIHTIKQSEVRGNQNDIAFYYFRVNRDSSVMIQRGVNSELGDPILYKDMEKTMQDKFAKAVQFSLKKDQ